MKDKLIILLTIVCMFAFTACNDDDIFSTSTVDRLSFEADTINFDTVFSTIPSPHKQMKIYNRSGSALRIVNARLESGNQLGFRVNVNGSYLSEEQGYQVNDLELRNGDSLRIFAEVTTKEQHTNMPTEVSDNIIFTLESGIKQKVNLNAISWDAYLLRNLKVENDTVLSNKDGKPIVVYGGISVGPKATMTIEPGTTIYFDHGAGIDVEGKIIAAGEKDKEITLRSNRLDRMVSNLMYDNNPGQWGGIHLAADSYDNVISYTDIHAGTSGVLCDSAIDSSRKKLMMDHSTIHNMKGHGIKANTCNITLENCQISNVLDTCLAFIGGNIEINNCTVAQYYPFDARRGPAMTFANKRNGYDYPITMRVRNSIVKGYADDVIWWSYGGEDTDEAMDVRFEDCLVRTPMPEDKDAIMFEKSIIDNVEDTMTTGKNSFVLFDTHGFFYDFTPVKTCPAIGTANPDTSLADDRKGNPRDAKTPDMGCYETDKSVKDESEDKGENEEE